jgi:hypothetical protein
MRLNRIALILVVLTLVVAPLAAVAGEGCSKKAAAEVAKCGKGCCGNKGEAAVAHCDKCAEAAELATNAEAGCAKSASKLIEMAKDSGCPEGAALAVKAEKGDEEALAELATMCGGSKQEQGHHAEAAMLASNAKNGCAKSSAKLVELAKSNGCPRSAALAAKAEKGDEEARAELIAMYAGGDE